jgi:O-acetyl-ADP-ribose deacetylase (regulator of RNase III)
MSDLKQTYPLPNDRRLEISQGDITKEEVDAIVNAANDRLQHGGGVAGAIVRAGGMSIQAESNAWVSRRGPVSHAEPAYTKGYKLPARYVIHAVGPINGEGDEENKLAAAVSGSLKRVDGLGLHSVAFPAISTGIFGFPPEDAARVFMQAIPAYFAGHPRSGISLVRLVLWDDDTLATFLAAAHRELEDKS